ncbi:hypothetical protein F5888DRAFT_1635131 [Russula emetica]|nr:hypothetical protein F5888DRAFT_1635131 [Russula emetica]
MPVVDFHDPVTFARVGNLGIYRDAFFSTAATVNLWHTMDGIFIWEFFTTLNYKWDVIQGIVPTDVRWTIWVYSLTRFATLMAVILNLVGLDGRAKINCHFFAYVAFGSASLLVVFHVAFLINVSDVVLLLVMLVGLLRLRLEIGQFGLGRILWTQGLAWLLLATVAGGPFNKLYSGKTTRRIGPRTTLFATSRKEDIDSSRVSATQMFQCPNMVIMTISATRMYRSLMNRGTTEISNETLGGARHTVSTIQFRSQQVPLKWMPAEVSLLMDSDCDQYPNSQSGSGDWDTYTDPYW